jgi:acetoacetate decarboxylase
VLISLSLLLLIRHKVREVEVSSSTTLPSIIDLLSTALFTSFCLPVSTLMISSHFLLSIDHLLCKFMWG